MGPSQTLSEDDSQPRTQQNGALAETATNGAVLPPRAPPGETKSEADQEERPPQQELTQEKAAESVAKLLKLHYFRTVFDGSATGDPTKHGTHESREVPSSVKTRDHNSAVKFLFGENPNRKFPSAAPGDGASWKTADAKASTRRRAHMSQLHGRRAGFQPKDRDGEF